MEVGHLSSACFFMLGRLSDWQEHIKHLRWAVFFIIKHQARKSACGGSLKPWMGPAWNGKDAERLDWIGGGLWGSKRKQVRS